MLLKKLFPILVIVFVFQILPWTSQAANRLLYENFDDQSLDGRLIVLEGTSTILDPPQYNIDAVGRGGSGHCFSSGTVNAAYMSWQNPPNPWPTNAFYVSFWLRYPNFKSVDPTTENIKVFYPHWQSTKGYVHYTLYNPNQLYYSASAPSGMLAGGIYLDCPGMTDGQWHHYEFYVGFLSGISRFRYDGVMKLDSTYGSGKWTNQMDSFNIPSIDAWEPGVFSRQVDDIEIWDGM